MGYDLWIKRVDVSQKYDSSGSLLFVDAALTNTGVAPFYYDLTLLFEVKGIGNSTVFASQVASVPRILPGDAAQVSVSIRIDPLQWKKLTSVVCSLQCPRCYIERPVLLANGGVNQTTGRLKLDVGSFYFRQREYNHPSPSPGSSVNETQGESLESRDISIRLGGSSTSVALTTSAAAGLLLYMYETALL